MGRLGVMRKFGKFFRDIAFPALLACWVAYLGYGAIAGAAGYRHLSTLKKEAADKRIELELIQERRLVLSQRAKLLHPRSLDADMIDERIRAVLGYAEEGDVVVPRDEIERVIREMQAPAR